ncbi:YjjI family glycine radical enzyme [Parasedimentitalea psychrophila]|uniref:YjjI family glycine radical enzyme n=1 Tax=Parasedimentitalea psychrophila TaxID=2997337 RepID=A0A9Y2KZP5_9RHOB|nr:YjjI family glycine radical enzyme [Parasedimentitalea psychrophila]WIY24996.1 YjjI family glycine radical enzyme [Parasedimentitalea psychrophila]
MPSETPHIRHIVNDPTLSSAQKARALSLEAENSLPYPALDRETQDALEARLICDMYEGHAPYKPRYVLPDYGVVLKNGSEWLELPVPQTLDEAIHTLMIAYHHVPSVTAMPVYIGQLDDLLLPFCDGVTDADLYQQIKLFWRYLDRVLPDAFMHANIGPTDNRVARIILQVDAELKQIAPNLTFLYDPKISSDAILQVAASNITKCSKPHIANHPLHDEVFGERGYGIVSCYNALPLQGGASTLTRINLAKVAKQSDDVEDFLTNKLPHYVDLNFRLTEARIDYLFNQSGFFDSFLVTEGWLDETRFTAMFGIFAMAEAVNELQDKIGATGRYGHDAQANALGYKISALLDGLVSKRPMKNVWKGRAMLHSQAGLSTDTGFTPGVRIPYGTEPDPVTHVLALAPHHQYYGSGVSEILTLDETIKANPEAVTDLCKGAFAKGFREFTANVGGNDLVRVTGYMIRLSDVAQFHAEQGSRTNTTALGAEASKQTLILQRKPRVVANELLAGTN